MANQILEVYKEPSGEFNWRRYYIRRRASKGKKELLNIIASGFGYNKKQTLHMVMQKSILPGWNFDWKKGIATCITIPSVRSRNNSNHKIKIIDLTLKK